MHSIGLARLVLKRFRGTRPYGRVPTSSQRSIRLERGPCLWGCEPIQGFSHGQLFCDQPIAHLSQIGIILFELLHFLGNTIQVVGDDGQKDRYQSLEDRLQVQSIHARSNWTKLSAASGKLRISNKASSFWSRME